MQPIAELVISHLKHVCNSEYPNYAKAINAALTADGVAFGEQWYGKRYFDLASDAEWFSNSLVENSRLEGFGATQIWRFSNRLVNREWAALARQHAMDESRHSTMFVSMLELTFPGILDDKVLSDRLGSLSPHYSRTKHPSTDITDDKSMHLQGEDALDELIQVHLTEIRALVLQYLLREAILVHSPEASHPRLRQFVNSLIKDETRHIEYCASIFEQELVSVPARKDYIFETMIKRQLDLNELALEEVDNEIVEI